jgi:hypothetical protein
MALLSVQFVKGVKANARSAANWHLYLAFTKGNFKTKPLTSIEEDAQALPLVGGPKDGPILRSAAGEPDGKAIAVQRVGLAVHAELPLDLEGGGGEREPGPEPAGLGGAVLRQADCHRI